MTKRKPVQPRLLELGGTPAVARVRRYVDRQLRAQRSLGQLEPVDDGLVGIAMTMADVIDAEVTSDDRSAFVIVTGLAKLVPVLLHLRGEHRGPDVGDFELEQLAAAVRDAERSGPSESR